MTDLFTPETQTTPTTVAPVAVADPLLATIVNEEGKPKYASVPEALKALAHAQAHLKTLETENSQLREATTKALTLEEVLKAIKPSEAAVVTTTAPDKSEQVDIASVVASTLAKMENDKTASANVTSVVERMKETYGDKASESFYTKANELGFSKEDINQLAAKNPKAVFKLFGMEEKKVTKNIQSSISTDSFLTAPTTNKKPRGMANGSTKELLDAWRHSVAKTNQKLGIN